MSKKQPNRYRNVPYTSVIRYVSVVEGERDSAFLHNKNGTNSWPLVTRSSEEIADALRKFHNRNSQKAIDF